MVLRLIAAVVVSSGCYVLTDASPPALSVTLSRQTTVITKPLTEDGLPDYEAHFLNLGREDVTPENNAAVALWRAIWPGDLAAEDRGRMVEALGLSQEPEEAAPLAPVLGDVTVNRVARWLGDPDDCQAAKDLIEQAMVRPWTAEQIPPLAAWVQENASQLDTILEATKLPRFWSPSPLHLNDTREMLIANQLHLVARLRSMAQGLQLRAMHLLAQGKTAEALDHVNACLRLAGMIGPGPTLLHSLVAFKLAEGACQSCTALLADIDLPAEAIRSSLLIARSLHARPDVTSKIDEGERLLACDALLSFLHAGDKLDESEKGLKKCIEMGVDVDWMLSEINRCYDEMVKIARNPSRAERDLLSTEWSQSLEESGRFLTRQSINQLFSDRRVRSRMVVTYVKLQMVPSLGAALRAEEWHNVRMKLTIAALAVAQHKQEEGRLPDRLNEVSTVIGRDWRTDPYSGEPFVYKSKPDGGFLLYSVYENGVDDDGNHFEGGVVAGEWADGEAAPDKTDFVIRVPVPSIEIPTRALD